MNGKLPLHSLVGDFSFMTYSRIADGLGDDFETVIRERKFGALPVYSEIHDTEERARTRHEKIVEDFPRNPEKYISDDSL